MIDYDSGVGPIPNNTGNYPSVTSNNVTAPGAGDGTPYLKAFIDDLWGHNQDILNLGGLTPNGASEASGASQRTDALKNLFGAPGEVILWHGPVDPATLGRRLLLLEGQVVLIANYPDLVAAAYIGDGNNGNLTFVHYYKCSDPAGAVRNIAGPYFKIADSQGCTVRGYDPTAIRDELGATRKFPDIQTSAIRQHQHELITSASGYAAKYTAINIIGTGDDTLELLSGATGDRLQATSVFNGGTISSLENRMINLQVKMCVRY